MSKTKAPRLRPRNKGSKGRNILEWRRDLEKHSYGNYSVALVQANEVMEDQSQVMNSSFGTFVGVYDGHGGPDASLFVNHHLFKYTEQLAFEEGGMSVDVLKMSLKAAEEEFSSIVMNCWRTRLDMIAVGASCLVGFITNDFLYAANVGDCRAVLGRRGPKKSIIAERLTDDHNAASENVRNELQSQHPDDPDIVIRRHGTWRVKGLIEVSRSIGDVCFKNPEVYRDPVFMECVSPLRIQRPVLTAEPDVYAKKLHKEHKFLILASDGLWNELSDQQAVEIVNKHPRHGIAQRLVRCALLEAAKKGKIEYDALENMEKGIRRSYHDDITVIVIFVNHKILNSKDRRRDSNCTVSPADIFSANAMEQGCKS